MTRLPEDRRLLRHEDILSLRAAAVSAGLTGSRGALLACVPADVVASLPVASIPGEQVLMDLDALNTMSVLADGCVPLLVWLANACALAGGRPESQVFLMVVDRCRNSDLCLDAPQAFPIMSSGADATDSRRATAAGAAAASSTITITKKEPEMVHLVVELVRKGERHDIEAPLCMLASEFLAELLIAFDIPRSDSGGHPLNWRIDNRTRGRSLDPNRTLEENELEELAVLRLVCAIVAG